MPFCTPLDSEHLDAQTWRLTGPLVWRGQWQYIVIARGFETDFASIPKPLRWLLDNAGRNAEAGVLHDAVWRESQVAGGRVDPWYADGMLRRALRETGSTALTRTLIWFGVRAAATVSGRFGKRGPSLQVKLAQLFGAFLLGAATALPVTVVVAVGTVIFWVWNWICSVAWFAVRERRSHSHVNWPWPVKRVKPDRTKPPPNLLLVLSFEPEPWQDDAPAPSPAELACVAALEEILGKKLVPTQEQIAGWGKQTGQFK